MAVCLTFTAGVSVAGGVDDLVPGPTTTATETYTVPTPDPAPVPQSAPRPKPKAAPRPAPRVYRPAPVAPAPASVPTPIIQSQPTVTRRAPKRHVVHKARKKHRKPTVVKAAPTPIPSVVAAKGVQSGVLGAQSTIIRAGTDSFDLDALLIVAALSLAIACFGIASFPATFVPWRPATRLVVSGRVPLIFVGVGVSAASFLVARGSW